MIQSHVSQHFKQFIPREHKYSLWIWYLFPQNYQIFSNNYLIFKFPL